MLLKNAKDADLLIEAVGKCKGDVIMISTDRTETYNLKSVLSRYIAIGRLAEEKGDFYEIYCLNREDEHYMMEFFYQLGE